MRKKEIPEDLGRSMSSLYQVARIIVRVDSELSDEFDGKVGMHQWCVLSSVLFPVVVDAVTELTREGVLSELLYADYLS